MIKRVSAKILIKAGLQYAPVFQMILKWSMNCSKWCFGHDGDESYKNIKRNKINF